MSQINCISQTHQSFCYVLRGGETAVIGPMLPTFDIEH